LFPGRCFIGAEDVKCGDVFLWFVVVPYVLYCIVTLPPGERPFSVIIINNNNKIIIKNVDYKWVKWWFQKGITNQVFREHCCRCLRPSEK
jgi:hypothetical protein